MSVPPEGKAFWLVVALRGGGSVRVLMAESQLEKSTRSLLENSMRARNRRMEPAWVESSDPDKKMVEVVPWHFFSLGADGKGAVVFGVCYEDVSGFYVYEATEEDRSGIEAMQKHNQLLREILDHEKRGDEWREEKSRCCGAEIEEDPAALGSGGKRCSVCKRGVE